ncbi:MAG TPA: hypothetical protein VJV78_30500, partial [Polyangiales bacterium]|nr:hypothetical protein [Polyangiales bacterium]
MRRSLFALPLVLAALSAACDESEPATAVLVTVDSDLSPGSQLNKVLVEVRDSEGNRKSPRQAFTVTEGTPSGTRVRLPFSFGLSRSGDKQFQLSLVGIDEDGDPLVSYTVSAEFQDKKTLGLSVFLAKLCLNNSCGDDPEKTCYPRDKGDVDAGSCGEIPSDSLPTVDPDMDLPDRVDAG